MTGCMTLPPAAPIIYLTLVGTGEPLLRMEKRLFCAAGGLGIRLEVETRKDVEALGNSLQQSPAVLHDGKLIFNGLHRTEAIEDWLKSLK